MANTAPIHFELANMILEMMHKGTHRKQSYDKVNSNGNYQQVEIDIPSFALEQEIAIVDLSIYDDLKINAIKLLIEIQKELAINNPIWEFKYKHLSESRAALKQLIYKDILRPIANTDLYIVNPEKIRRGKPLTVLAAIYMYCKTSWEKDKRWRISSADIKRLLAPKEVKLIRGTNPVNNMTQWNITGT